ncbi:MAG: SCP2 sterol-binding domain-containing protein [Omnitrophica WOR_2 bacterium]
MATEVSIQQLMAGMPRAFIPEKATGVNTVIQYHLTGAEGGDWVVKIHDGQCTVEPGATPAPNLTLTADAQDYKDIITGKTNAMAAFMQGKVKLAGDLNMAMKLTSFFKM